MCFCPKWLQPCNATYFLESLVAIAICINTHTHTDGANAHKIRNRFFVPDKVFFLSFQFLHRLRREFLLRSMRRASKSDLICNNKNKSENITKTQKCWLALNVDWNWNVQYVLLSVYIKRLSNFVAPYHNTNLKFSIYLRVCLFELRVEFFVFHSSFALFLSLLSVLCIPKKKKKETKKKKREEKK